MSWLDKLAERRMQAAVDRGELQGLSGAGKPLAEPITPHFVSALDAVGYRIMAEAGVIPEEIRLQKECDALRAFLATLSDPKDVLSAQKKLADLETQRGIAIDARRRFMKT
jgi:hypothetical protein